MGKLATQTLVFLYLLSVVTTVNCEVAGLDSTGSGPFLEVDKFKSDDAGRRNSSGGDGIANKPRGKLSLLRYVQLEVEDRLKSVTEKEGLRCFCDTDDCVASGHASCTTTGSCYTQILVLEDGSPPVTRGCIDGETPLLCENRKPKNQGAYPTLRCCKSHLCNHPPPYFTPSQTHHITRALEQAWTRSSTMPHQSFDDQMTHQMNQNEFNTTDDRKSEDAPRLSVSLQISTLAKASLIGAAVSVVLISVVGFLLLRRERQKGGSDANAATRSTGTPVGALNKNDIGKVKVQTREMRSLLTLPESVV